MLLAAAGLAAACSSSTSGRVNQPSGSSSLAHVGDTLDLTTAAGRPFQLAVTQVVDPARGSGSSPSAGRRYVAVLLQFTNTSSHELSGNSNADTNLVGGNGQTYVPAHVTLRECGNSSVEYQLSQGKTVTDCVAFEIKKSVHVTKVQFFPAAGTAADYGEWLVP